MSDFVDFTSKKFLTGIALGVLLAETIYYTVDKLSGRHRRTNEAYFKPIFFPDQKVACRTHFTSRHGCTDQRCDFSHDPASSYAQLLRALTCARKSLEVCVFIITCEELGNAIVDLHNRGVIVRIITDQDNQNSSGSQVMKFRSQGIQVRLGGGTHLMHHKFAVVDGRQLINGSFNWTRSAISWNNENLLLSNHGEIVQPYREQFEKLWQLYDPSLRQS